jgi:hypothetical protein
MISAAIRATMIAEMGARTGRRVRRALVAAMMAAAVAASACGGGNGSGDGNGNGGPPTAPTPNPQDPNVQTINGTVASFAYNEHQLTISRSGNLTVTLTWQGPADLDLYLTSGDCADVYGASACERLVVSDQLTGSSEAVARAVQSGERYKIWVDNFTLAAQPYTLQIDIR